MVFKLYSINEKSDFFIPKFIFLVQQGNFGYWTYSGKYYWYFWDNKFTPNNQMLMDNQLINLVKNVTMFYSLYYTFHSSFLDRGYKITVLFYVMLFAWSKILYLLMIFYSKSVINVIILFCKCYQKLCCSISILLSCFLFFRE